MNETAKSYGLTKRQIIKVVSGVLYEMSPYNLPRGIETIVTHCAKYIDEKFANHYVCRMDEEEVKAFITDMLESCVEYQQLNISQAEWDEGIRDPNDPMRKGLFGATFVGHHDDGSVTISKTMDYYDFVDLGASTPNIINEIMWSVDSGEDCFLCKHSAEYMSGEPSNTKRCRHCTLNPQMGNHYEIDPRALVPRGKKNE